MLNITRKQVSDDLIIEGLQKTWSMCEEADYNSKKYMGLINDFIPYEEGLKAQFEIMARSGYLKKLKSLKTSDPKKIDKLLMKYMNTYGFSETASRRAFSLQLKAMGHEVDIPEGPDVKAVKATPRVSGGFSGKWLEPTPEKKIDNKPSEPQLQKSHPTMTPPTPLSQEEKIQQELAEYQQKRKKKVIRNKFNLFKIMILMGLAIAAYVFMMNQFINLNDLRQVFDAYVLPLNFSNLWLIRAIIVVISAILIPIVIYKLTKKNILPIIPVAVIFGQVASIMLKTRLPIAYEFFQLALIVGIMIVALFTTLASVRLPKGAKDFISYKAIGIYYVTVIFYFVGQYFVRISVV